MISFLKPQVSPRQVRPNDVLHTYKSLRFKALLGAFLGYVAYYIVRNNFALSTPYLKHYLNLSTTQIGLLSSYMLIAYGISKGVMSSIADKADPKRYMALGLTLCAMVNILLGFSTAFWMFALLVVLNGFFQGMGVGPCFITISNWFPRKERGIASAIWNMSHNLGGAIVAPIVALGFYMVGQDHWRIASYQIPALVALLFVFIILLFCKGIPTNEGLPPLAQIIPEKDEPLTEAVKGEKAPEDMSARQIFMTYVFRNKDAWLVSWMDAFVYTVRFGMISWLPLYLLEVKGYTKIEMGIAFLTFEIVAMPATLVAGYISDKLFRGYRMPPAIISMVLIFFGVIGYWQSETLGWTIFFAAMVGCLIYIPQFLASVQTMEVVPSFAVGSAVGLRGFMSYIVGALIGTSIFGIMVDLFGWQAGFIVLQTAVILCIVTSLWIHLRTKKLERNRIAAQK
jgi:OPA family phosphoglycerate-like MFS transporter